MGTDPAKVLVLGGTGMLGHEAVRVLAGEFEVHATVRDPSAAAHLLDAELHELDAFEPRRLPALLGEVRPGAVLNCIGVVKQLEDASRPIPAITLNSLFPHQLAEACAAAGARLVHVSTDCVFSGELEPPARYREDDLPDARDLYGRTKLLGEVAGPGALTLRTSIVGRELERASGLLEWAISQSGRTVAGFANALFSGLTTTAFARIVAEVLRDHPGLDGVLHVSSEPIDKHDLLERLDARLDLGLTIERSEEPRVNRALDSSRFRDLTGIEVPSWNAMLSEHSIERIT